LYVRVEDTTLTAAAGDTRAGQHLTTNQLLYQTLARDCLMSPKGFSKLFLRHLGKKISRSTKKISCSSVAEVMQKPPFGGLADFKLPWK